MNIVVRSAMVIVASGFIAVTAAFAQAAQPTPLPVAGAGIVALGLIGLVGRKLRRKG